MRRRFELKSMSSFEHCGSDATHPISISMQKSKLKIIRLAAFCTDVHSFVLENEIFAYY